MQIYLILTVVLAILLIAASIFILIILKKHKEAIKTYDEIVEAYEKSCKESERLLHSYEITFDNYQNLMVVIKDTLPKKHDARSYAMKLANELAPYFKINEEKEEVSLVIYKGEM